MAAARVHSAIAAARYTSPVSTRTRSIDHLARALRTRAAPAARNSAQLAATAAASPAAGVCDDTNSMLGVSYPTRTISSAATAPIAAISAIAERSSLQFSTLGQVRVTTAASPASAAIATSGY